LKPALSYAYAAFHAGDYDRYPEPLARLWGLGFRWVTLIPTFAVREPFEIVPGYTPPLATIRAVLLHALALGFDVKVEPHIDWQATLDGAGEWRGLMQFDPAGEYFDKVIAPMRELAVNAKLLYPDHRIALTLGSEVDRSVRDHPEAWLAVRRRARAEGIATGHKFNHDAGRALLRSEYVASLDWVSFSFYPAMGFRQPPEWWRAPHAAEEYEDAAERFRQAAADLGRKLPRKTAFEIGEFGLGSSDVEHSYKLDPSFFTSMDDDGRRLLRNYYTAFLQSLQGSTAGLVTFWSAGYFDFLGVFDSRYKKDEELIRLVEEYNR
jgi:hypothetical protein